MTKNILIAVTAALLLGSLVMAASWNRDGGGAAPASRDIFPKVLKH